MTTIRVLVDRPYDVHVGFNILGELSNSIQPSVARVAILSAPAVKHVAQKIAESLSQEIVLIELEDSEKAKTVQSLARCWDELGAAGFTRSDLIISVGGGATTDLAGFVAATWLRGVGVIHVPTTLLAMVDAAVGGKTGINTSVGKNLVGSFYHPLAVWCDIDVLKTLPKQDLRAGFGEIIKCGFISDLSILDTVKEFGASLVDSEHDQLSSLISRAITVKAEVVADDFTESKVGGLGREILNYGHTFGHAIEVNENYSWRHGEAISVGMIFVAELANIVGVLSADKLKTHRELIESLGLPTTYSGQDSGPLIASMSMDKKSRGNMMRFIVLSDFGVPQVLSDPSIEDLQTAFSRVSAHA